MGDLLHDETVLEPIGNGRFATTVSSAWNIGENPNGGYLMAVVLPAMAAHPDVDADAQPDPLTLTAHFLRPGLGGAPGELDVEVVKPGRTLTVVRATLRQDGRERLLVTAGLGDLGSGADDPRVLDVPPPDLPPPDECVDRSSLAQGVDLPLLDRVEVRIDPATAEMGTGGDARMRGWIRLGDGSDPRTSALPLFADAFPPALFTRYGRVGWVPTLEMTVHVRRRPAPGWVAAAFEVDDLSGGRMVETGALWDETGALVARSRQLGLLLGPVPTSDAPTVSGA